MIGRKPTARAASNEPQKSAPSQCPASPAPRPASGGPRYGSHDGGLGIDLDDTATDLVEFDGVEQGLEVAVAEALVALALDDLEEDRAEGVLGEDLQQQAFLVRAVDQDAVLAHALDVLAVVRQAFVDQFEIGFDRVLEVDAAGLHGLDGLENVLGGQGDVLDALAVVAPQEFLDLGVVVLAFVQRDADGAVGRDHGLGEQAGGLALDVEILLLFEVEDRVVEAGPGAHLAATDVVGQVVEDFEAHRVLALGLFPALDLVPLVVEGAGLAVLVDDVEERAADALQDVGIVVPEGAAGGVLGRDRAAGQGAFIGGLGVGDAEGHAVGRRTVIPGEVGGLAGRGLLDKEADVALL